VPPTFFRTGPGKSLRRKKTKLGKRSNRRRERQHFFLPSEGCRWPFPVSTFPSLGEAAGISFLPSSLTPPLPFLRLFPPFSHAVSSPAGADPSSSSSSGLMVLLTPPSASFSGFLSVLAAIRWRKFPQCGIGIGPVGYGGVSEWAGGRQWPLRVLRSRCRFYPTFACWRMGFRVFSPLTFGQRVFSDPKMGVYLSTPKTEKFSEDGENERLRFGLSSMQGWRANMEDAHAALPDLDNCTSFFGVYDGHGGKVVAKFCAKYLHTQVLKSEAYSAGDLGASVQKAFFRMDEMMRGQRGWRELAILGDKINKLTGMIEGFIWSPRAGDCPEQVDHWAFEEGPHSDFAGPTSGSTACVAIIRNNQLVIANAGDSRCVISRKGQAYNLSRDHKPELDAERERILKAGGFIHAGRVNGSLNLARAIGDMEFKQNKFLPVDRQIITANPDINIVEFCEDDDFIVLACDGIW
ncbi:hypothetical protein Taro_014127, partial [Colocasia esculenta]|nr:hypothetical protein [Colocasia esculenta]